MASQRELDARALAGSLHPSLEMQMNLSVSTQRGNLCHLPLHFHAAGNVLASFQMETYPGSRSRAASHTHSHARTHTGMGTCTCTDTGTHTHTLGLPASLSLTTPCGSTDHSQVLGDTRRITSAACHGSGDDGPLSRPRTHVQSPLAAMYLRERGTLGAMTRIGETLVCVPGQVSVLV